MNENETLQQSLEMKVRIQKLDQYQNKKLNIKIVFFSFSSFAWYGTIDITC